MSLQFAVLASGSRGNSTLIRARSGPGLVIDCGLGSRDLTQRLASVGASWDPIRAVLLTHTHGDHVTVAALSRLKEHGVQLYCHEGHRNSLSRHDVFAQLEADDLVRHYDHRPFLAPCGFWVEPIELSHDGGPTYGFRIEGRGERRAKTVSVGYLADSGIWTERMADALAEVDVLGVEFNHDVDLQRRSGRSPWTIARNLGRFGHLSNDQGAALVSSVLGRSGSFGPRQIVLLHISQQCNLSRLAISAARKAVREAGRRVTIQAAEQGFASPNLIVEPKRGRMRGRAKADAVSEYNLTLPF